MDEKFQSLPVECVEVVAGEMLCETVANKVVVLIEAKTQPRNLENTF